MSKPGVIMKGLQIGISACMFHPDKERATFAPKTLLYFERSMAQMLMRHGVYPILVPSPINEFDLSQVIAPLDALVLAGGADVSPLSYGESSEKWPGDELRDIYEIALFREAVRQNKPVLGICRGHQIINVAQGGTLYQDLATQAKTQVEHRNAKKYDQVFHSVALEIDSILHSIYQESSKQTKKVVLQKNDISGESSSSHPPHEVCVNSVHHQAIKDLGADLVVEARSVKDGVIEAIRLSTSGIEDVQAPFVLGVQWHPEFMIKKVAELLDQDPLLKTFISVASQRKRLKQC